MRKKVPATVLLSPSLSEALSRWAKASDESQSRGVRQALTAWPPLKPYLDPAPAAKPEATAA